MEKIKLSTHNVSIEFPGVKALEDINFDVSTGEIRAVVGANGAGKSTLMKVFAGANPTYTGEVMLDGRPVELRTPVDAKKLGIQIVYQEVDTSLVPTLSVAENIMLNEMVMTGGVAMNWKHTREEAKKALDRLHVKGINVRTLVQDLSLAQKQMVLIARAVRLNCNFLILDEPTAPLSTSETKELFKTVNKLRETENIAILFISHRLDEILEICESYTVMRNGKIVDNCPITDQTTTKEIVEKMLGRSFEESFPKEVCDKIKNPSDAVKSGIAFVPEERRKEGVLVDESVSFNLSAANLGDFCTLSFIDRSKVKKNAEKFVDSLGIKTPTIKQQVRLLSGGNQQKVVVGKWLGADSDIYIFDEPTKGVDVGAKQDIFHLINEIAKSGKGVIYASCENAELLSLTDKLYVMYSGRIVAELETKEARDERIMNLSVGGNE